MLGRRTFLHGSLLALLGARTVSAQPATAARRRVGILASSTRESFEPNVQIFRASLERLGWVEGRNLALDVRYASSQYQQLASLAAELVTLKVDVIFAMAAPAIQAAKRATKTIPIVIETLGDAVSAGLVPSLARPGGNVTGVTDQSVELSAKRLEVLKEAIPKAVRIAVLWNADDRGMTLRYQSVEKAARDLHVTVQPLGVREPDDFDAAFSAMTASRPDALFLVTDALTLLNRQRVIDFALAHRIPAMYEFANLVRDGGLMSYGADPDDNYRRAAGYVDRILKGAAPSTLPVERPSRYYLTINLRTARALGLTLPPSMLLRADQLIE
jgi:ABC-type uncharacterized transport system substrate-binding protein